MSDERTDWQAVSARLRDIVERDASRVPMPPTAAIVSGARQRTPERKRRVWLLAPAFALAVVIAVLVLRPRAVPSELGPGTVTALANDQVRVAAQGHVTVVSAEPRGTLLTLDAGAATFEVDATRGKRDFRVRVGKLMVHVTGTKFTVAKREDGARVSVSEGSVVVLRDGEQVARLSEGGDIEVHDRPADAAPPAAAEPNAPAEPPQVEPTVQRDDAKARAPVAKTHRALEPKYEAWGTAAVTGRCKTVIPAMQARVDAIADDTRTWSLLADCLRKERRLRDSKAAYERVIASGSASAAQRARYLAAEIALDGLDDAASAIPLLRTYIAKETNDGAQARTARLRLGRALIQTGDKSAAAVVLRELVERAPSTPEARSANDLLDVVERR